MRWGLLGETGSEGGGVQMLGNYSHTEQLFSTRAGEPHRESMEELLCSQRDPLLQKGALSQEGSAPRLLSKQVPFLGIGELEPYCNTGAEVERPTTAYVAQNVADTTAAQ